MIKSNKVSYINNSYSSYSVAELEAARQNIGAAPASAVSSISAAFSGYYTKPEMDAIISDFGGFEKVSGTGSDNHPDVEKPNTHKIYLVKDASVKESDKYKEWIYTTTWELIGDTSLNLDGYQTISGMSAYQPVSAMSGYADAIHNHEISAVNGLSDELDKYAEKIYQTEVELTPETVEYTLKNNEFIDFGTLDSTITSLKLIIGTDEVPVLKEYCAQFKVSNNNFICTIEDKNNKTLYYANWPDMFEAGSVYQITIVNNCVAVGTFEELV